MREFFFAFLILLFVLGVLIFTDRQTTNKLEQLCRQQYGQEAIVSDHRAETCVLKDGQIRGVR